MNWSPPPDLTLTARALVVDDDAFLCRALKATLVSLGWEVETACGSQEAYRAAKLWAPHMALIDVRIHGAPQGFGIAQILRERYPDMRIGLITGYQLTDDQRRRAEHRAGGGLKFKPLARADIEQADRRVRMGLTPFPTIDEPATIKLHAPAL